MGPNLFWGCKVLQGYHAEKHASHINLQGRNGEIVGCTENCDLTRFVFHPYLCRGNSTELMFVLGMENGNPSPLEERGLQWWIRSYDFPRQFNNWSVVSTVDML